MRIIIASHERSTRSAVGMLIRAQPDLQLVGEAGDLTDLLLHIKTSQPDLVILDWDVLGKRIETLLDLLELFENPPEIIGLSVHEGQGRIALPVGVSSFAYKCDPPALLLEAIRACRPQNDNDQQGDEREAKPKESHV